MEKTVVITGSTRGLGMELAKQFRMRDWNVVLCGTTREGTDRAAAALGEIPGKGGIVGQKCNVASLADIEALAQLAMEAFGQIDIWINNAGVNQSYRYAWEVSEEEIDFLLNVDLKGAINGTGTAIRYMLRQGSGMVFNMEGMGSNDAFQPCFTLYGTAKRAVTYYTDGVAKEINAQQLPIVVGKLSPGIMITDFLTSAEGKQGQTVLNDKTKKVYNILGDYPDVIAEYLVSEILKTPKNGCRISWLTNRKAAWRFMTSRRNKRDFFREQG